MTCEELRRLLDEEGAASTPEAQAHLAACPDCMLLARRWAEVQGALRGMGQEPAPPFLHARIMAHVRAAEAIPVSPNRSFLHGWRAPAVAALGAAVVIVGLGLYSAVRPLAAPEPARPSVLAEPLRQLRGKRDRSRRRRLPPPRAGRERQGRALCLEGAGS